jgi:hypothetical protein
MIKINVILDQILKFSMLSKAGMKILNLSAKGLAMISWVNYECDFTFQIGTEEYF